MKFLKTIRNFLRCVFCRKIWKKRCKSRFTVGRKVYYSYLGPTIKVCPKDMLKNPTTK